MLRASLYDLLGRIVCSEVCCNISTLSDKHADSPRILQTPVHTETMEYYSMMSNIFIIAFAIPTLKVHHGN